MDTSKGVWEDSKTGKLVNAEPEEGRLLVAPDGPVSPYAAAVIEAAEKGKRARTEKATAGTVETAAAPKAVSTADIRKRG